MQAKKNEPKEVEIDKPIINDANINTCGLIMPISAIDGCLAQHWLDVRQIITESIGSIEESTYTVKLVSESEIAGVIQNRIVEAIFENQVVICDISCLNPNVMFELGLRLTTRKPTIIIKDDITKNIFDISSIEYVQYPRDLRYQEIQQFKKDLASKVVATQKAYAEKTLKTYLDHYGKFTVEGLPENSGTLLGYLERRMSQLSQDLSRQFQVALSKPTEINALTASVGPNGYRTDISDSENRIYTSYSTNQISWDPTTKSEVLEKITSLIDGYKKMHADGEINIDFNDLESFLILNLGVNAMHPTKQESIKSLINSAIIHEML